MKLIATVTVVWLQLAVSAAAGEPAGNSSPVDIRGEWEYDLVRSTFYNAPIRQGQPLSEDMKQQILQAVGTIPTQIRITITDDLMIMHANEHNQEQRIPYRVIGGNSAMAVIEQEREGRKIVGYVYTDAEGIAFARPECESYPEQCEQEEREYRRLHQNDGLTVISGGKPEEVSESFRNSLKERHFFRRVQTQ